MSIPLSQAASASSSSEIEKRTGFYHQWYRSAGFRGEGDVHHAINHGLQQYRSDRSFREAGVRRKIADAVSEIFASRSAWVERWPARVRATLNRNSGRPNSAELEPFTTWARPRDLEKREQSVAVWYNLLCFLVYHWGDFGAAGCLERMGLSLTIERLKELVDDMSIYGKMERRTKAAMKEVVEEFCVTAVMDKDPSSKTNPLLWWVGVLIQSEVLDHQARLPIARGEDVLDFPGKLEALNHYARVLTLQDAFQSWLNLKPPAPSEWNVEVIQGLDRRSMEWVDEDQERPQVNIWDEQRMVMSPAWQSCISHVRDFVQEWLVLGSRGPMHEILRLRQASRGEATAEKVTRLEYRVMMQIYENFTRSPVSDVYPCLCATKKTVEEANGAARRALTDELGSKKDVWQWDEMLRADGTIKIRAVFLDLANNAKATAWVEMRKVEKWSEGGSVDTREDDEDVDDDSSDIDSDEDED
jgi:hypothetical protein